MKERKKSPRANPKDPRKPIDDTQPRNVLNFPPSRMDPDGSWTGNPIDVRDMPQQDADDL